MGGVCGCMGWVCGCVGGLVGWWVWGETVGVKLAVLRRTETSPNFPDLRDWPGLWSPSGNSQATLRPAVDLACGRGGETTKTVLVGVWWCGGVVGAKPKRLPIIDLTYLRGPYYREGMRSFVGVRAFLRP